MKLTKIFRQQVDGKQCAVLIIDHDIYLIDFISERLLVFEGTPGIEGHVTGPFEMRGGMNCFLKELM